MEDKEGQQAQKTPKIAYEVALEEFDRWAVAWRIDTGVDSMNDDDADDFESLKRQITLQINSGNALVNDDDNIVYELFEPIGNLTEIELKRPRGRAWKVTDRAKKDRNIAKTDLLIATAIGKTPTIFGQMDGIDYKYIQAVYALFLGS